MRKKKTSILVRIISLLLVVGVIAGAVFAVRTLKGGSSAVPVYEVNSMAYDSSDAGSDGEMYGVVSSGQVQTIYISDTQTVTDVYVKAGQTVKKGDELMAYDTTLTDIEITRKELEIEKQKIELADLQKQVKSGVKTEAPPEEAELVAAEEEEFDPNQSSTTTETDGDNKETETDDANTGETDSNTEEEFNTDTGSDSKVEESNTDTGSSTVTEPDSGSSTDDTDSKDTDSDTKTTKTIKSKVSGGVVKTFKVVKGKGSAGSPLFVIIAKSMTINDTLINSLGLSGKRNYVVFLNTEGNKVKGAVTAKNGMICTKQEDGSYSMSFFDASSYSYGTDSSSSSDSYSSGGSSYSGDLGGGDSVSEKMTADEIAEAKNEIKETELEIKMAENELSEMKKEAENDKVVAKVDGVVSTVQDADKARTDGTPMIKVTGDGGYEITSSINELERDSLTIGEEITITSYETGNSYTGTVTEVGDTPTTAQDYSYESSANASYYPFTLSVPTDADLTDDEYVSLKRDSASVSEGSGFYLENMFILTEGSKRYVYVRNDKNKLEKREVKIGTISYGSTEILSGIDKETDWIAFPYGKNIKDGAATTESTYDELYDY